jgi:hypothetical protein
MIHTTDYHGPDRRDATRSMVIQWPNGRVVNTEELWNALREIRKITTHEDRRAKQYP